MCTCWRLGPVLLAVLPLHVLQMGSADGFAYLPDDALGALGVQTPVPQRVSIPHRPVT